MTARLTLLLELAREQLEADAVLAFRWADDGTAIVVGALPSPLAAVTGPAGAPLVLSLSRRAVEAAGGVLLEAADDAHRLVPEALHGALGAPPRAAAVIAAARLESGEVEGGPGGGLLAVWLAGTTEPRRAPDAADATDAAERQRLERTASVLAGALGAVLVSTVDVDSAERRADRLIAILTAAPQAMIFVDDAGEDSALNQAAAALLGLEPGPVSTEALTRSMAALQQSLENGDEVRKGMDGLLAEPDERMEDWVWQLESPTRRSLSVASVPVRAARLRGRLWTFDDITRQVDAERVARASEARFRALSTSSPIGIFQTDVSGSMIYANPRLHEIWGMPDGGMLGRGWLTRLHPDDLGSLLAARRAAIDAGEEYELDYRLVMPDGAVRQVQGQAAWLRNDGGEVIGGVGTVRDVTERLATARALAESEERLRLAFEAARMSAWDLDLRPASARTTTPSAASQVTAADELGLSFVGSTLRAYGSYAEFLQAVHPEDRARLDHAAARALRRRRDFEDEFRVVPADGEIRWRYVKGRMMLAGDGTPERMVGISVDSTERKTLEEELTRRAYQDPLTGLANRARFRDRVEKVMSRAVAATDEWPVATERPSAARSDADGGYRGPAVLFIDLDGFKAVNDNLGHDAGDRLLTLVASRLLGATRGSDTTAKLGGDEFAILLEHVDSHDDARIVASRVVEAIGASFDVDGQEVRVGASVGIAIATEEDDADTLLRNADLAMYRAKSSGRGRYAFYVPELQTAAAERLALEAELPLAIARGEFRLVYQPIVELATGELSGAEALVRWDHPERGLVGPLAFIPIAESTGDIVPLGRWILAEACREAMRWADGPCADDPDDVDGRRDGRGLTIAVNVSVRQLADTDFRETVAMVLRESGLPASMLVLEVTERSLLADSGVVVEQLQGLRELGVRLSVDDFGTGFSSLTYLQRSPFDLLRIDRTFTDVVTTVGERPTLASAVIALANALSMRTVAEGIESVEQRDTLIALGCSLGQGNFYAKPLAAEAFREYLYEARASEASGI